MSKELTVYQGVRDPLEFALKFGDEIAKSKMFGCSNEAQGRVLAFACLAEGKTPIEIIRKNHIISNKLSMRADAMLADFRLMGGRHSILARTAEKAHIKLQIADEEWEEELTWEEMKAEPDPWEKQEVGGTLKYNWSTPRKRRQMLWARVVSEAVHTLRPEINAGTYTPEEIADLPESNGETKVTQIVDVESFTKDHQPATAEETPAEETLPDGSTPEQRETIKQLFSTLNLDADQIHAVLTKRDCEAIHQLTHDQASELITALQNKIAGTAAPAPPESTAASLDDLVDEATIDKIKEHLTGDPELCEKIKAKLTEAGRTKIADLTQGDAELLLRGLEVKSMEQFFAASLTEVKPPFE